MEQHEAHLAADQHYQDIARITQLNADAERLARQRAVARMVEAARWRLVLGRSLIRLGTRLAGTPDGRLAP